MNSRENHVETGLPRSVTPNGFAPRPSLLPAFEPFSSSPGLPRPPKRKLEDSPSIERSHMKFYPTPVPTSATGIPPSSPLLPPSKHPLSLQRSISTVSERVPLGAVPTVTLEKNGEPLLMGRSSNSSHYQLSANRLISRIHVRTNYRAPNGAHQHGEIYIECLGWNGLKVHCRGKVYELGKGDTFSSDQPQAAIMLDVQDARVLLEWPALDTSSSTTPSPNPGWSDEDSPLPRVDIPSGFPSSPPQVLAQLHSPISPSPRDRLTISSTFLGMPSASSPTRPSVEVYEDDASQDESSPEEDFPSAQPEPAPPVPSMKVSEESSLLSDPDSASDNDEENDPIIHSFGTFGHNLQERMASIRAGSPPQQRRTPLAESTPPKQSKSVPSGLRFDLSPIRNHVINQLAFSRLHSLPLSTIMNNLPVSLKGGPDEVSRSGAASISKPKLLDAELKTILDEIPCVGEIAREGKDAAGKALEDEFYYVPDNDSDQMRRNAVQQKPGLRNVRKQHKVRRLLLQPAWKTTKLTVVASNTTGNDHGSGILLSTLRAYHGLRR